MASPAKKDRPEWPIPDFLNVSRRNSSTYYKRGWDAAARDYFFSFPPPDIKDRSQARRAWQTMPMDRKQVWESARVDFLELCIWGNRAFYTLEGACLVEATAAAASTTIARRWRRCKQWRQE